MAKDQKYTSKSGNEYEIKGGVYTGFGFNEKGQEKNNILSFDNPSEVRAYIEEREAGNRHFMDKE